MMGAEIAYMGTRFLATSKANIADNYQDIIINSSASDILYTPKMSGIDTSFIRQSVVDASVDPADPPQNRNYILLTNWMLETKYNQTKKRHGVIFGLPAKAKALLIIVLSKAHLIDNLYQSA
jgi:NAD(P)H-dependent flavin oxidoreductase YrpB (nitropropane dioxygenase family)